MKLAVFTGQYFWFDGKHYSTDEAFVEFVTSFHPYFEKIVFCDALKGERKTESYLLDPAKADVCALPDFSVYSCLRNILVVFPQIFRTVRDNIQYWDMIWLPGPHPVSFLFAFLCIRQRKAFFQVIRSNLLEQVRHTNTGLRKYFAMVAVAALQCACQQLAKRNLTFTVGRELFNKYEKKAGHVYETRISLVSHKDIEKTLETKMFELQKPLRLLSIGRLDAEKGLRFLVEAVDELVNRRDLEVVLHVVGKGYKGDEETRLHEEVRKRQLAEHVSFSGYVPFGPGLLKLYRESDIFVLPSLTGEGVPQTLFEAMACGIPIVATKVAGIPHVIRNGKDGLLINPASSSEIAYAVEALINNNELRHRLVKNGLDAVRSHTIEVERERILRGIQRFLGCRLSENPVFL